MKESSARFTRATSISESAISRHRRINTGFVTKERRFSRSPRLGAAMTSYVPGVALNEAWRKGVRLSEAYINRNN